VRVELLKELAVLRDACILSTVGCYDPLECLAKPESKAFRKAYAAAALNAQEMRVWRRICRTVPDPPAVVGKGYPVELP
jgi:hypothetical protein